MGDLEEGITWLCPAIHFTNQIRPASNSFLNKCRKCHIRKHGNKWLKLEVSTSSDMMSVSFFIVFLVLLIGIGPGKLIFFISFF